MRHKKVSLFEVNFLEFYWFLEDQSICIGKRNDKLKFWGVIYQIWLTGSKVMLKCIKNLLSESVQKRQLSTYQISIKIASSDCLYYDNELLFGIKGGNSET